MALATSRPGSQDALQGEAGATVLSEGRLTVLLDPETACRERSSHPESAFDPCIRPGPGVAIAAIASAVPKHCIDQRATRDIVLSIAPELRSHEALFLNTGIKTRYSCVPLEWHFEPHGWAARNRVFQDAAADLLESVSRECIDRAGIALDQVEAIVTVSTTGLAVPSLDAVLANRLGLPATVERLPIFGLGCAGGVSGLARAARMAQSLPRGNVLLLVVELCTINCRNTDHSIKNFISTALFGDGAAALLLRRAPEGKALPRLIASGEHMWRKTEPMMGWSIEDDGFGVVLSPDIPRCAREDLRPAVDHFLARHGLELGDLDGIVMHPGGRKVLEAAQTALAVSQDELRHAWDILAEYGNMSSPTALFVLQRALSAGASGLHLLAAFGPGFTVSFALLDL
jgi:alkylresorcinol/alkylpyrone synthase